jgi:cytochrome b561
MVFAVLVTYVSAYYRDWFTHQTETTHWYLLLVHINVGLLVFLLATTMLCLRWRLRQIRLHNLATSRANIIAKVMHLCLYFMIIALPLSAYIGTGFDLPLLGLVNFPGFFRSDVTNTWLQENLGLSMFTFIEPFGNFHKNVGANILLPLFLIGHITAAIYHQINYDKEDG